MKNNGRLKEALTFQKDLVIFIFLDDLANHRLRWRAGHQIMTKQ